MAFSEPVMYNESGFLLLKNSSGHVVASLNVTQNWGTALKFVPNGTLTVLPDVLLRGGTYTLEIPKGLILDMAGNPYGSQHRSSFTCLELKEDIVPPFVVMVAPTGSRVPGSTTRLSVWFSEDV